MARMVDVLTPAGAATAVDAEVDGEALWLNPAGLMDTTGFELKPEGLCRDEWCYPIPAGREAEFVRDGRINVAAFWRWRGGAVAASQERDVWALGDAGDEQQTRLDSLQAPDFTLPDMHGTLHSLSDYRGHKVFLVAWASW